MSYYKTEYGHAFYIMDNHVGDADGNLAKIVACNVVQHVTSGHIRCYKTIAAEIDEAKKEVDSVIIRIQNCAQWYLIDLNNVTIEPIDQDVLQIGDQGSLDIGHWGTEQVVNAPIVSMKKYIFIDELHGLMFQENDDKLIVCSMTKYQLHDFGVIEI